MNAQKLIHAQGRHAPSLASMLNGLRFSIMLNVRQA
jgi:hypothetical protein